MIRAALALVLLAAPAVQAADRAVLTRATTAHLELFTTAGEKRARESVVLFERLRETFVRSLHFQPRAGGRTRIFVFRDITEYDPYRMDRFTRAYTVPAADGDYVAFASTPADGLQFGAQEYTHVVIRQSGVVMPLWLEEGLAETYSSFKLSGAQVRVGELIPLYVERLRDCRWLNLPALFAVDRKSPQYTDRERTMFFRTASWALTHMLQFGPKYRGGAAELIAAVVRGETAAAAFWSVYGKNPDQVQADLVRYVQGSVMGPEVLPAGENSPSPQIAELSGVESEILLCRLLEVAGKPDAARARLAELSDANPKEARPLAALGELALHNKDAEEASRQFARAVQNGSEDGAMFFDYAMALRASGGGDKEIAEALRSAVRYAPGIPGGYYQLGQALMSLEQYKDAIQAFRSAKDVDVDQAFAYYCALAYASDQVGDRRAAAEALASARKFAVSAAERAEIERMAGYVARPVPTEARRDVEQQPAAAPSPAAPQVAGTLEQVDCLESKAVLHLDVNGTKRAFLIANPGNVAVRNSGQAEFACGRQKPRRVVIEYTPGPDAKLRTEGSVRSLEFN